MEASGLEEDRQPLEGIAVGIVLHQAVDIVLVEEDIVLVEEDIVLVEEDIVLVEEDIVLVEEDKDLRKTIITTCY